MTIIFQIWVEYTAKSGNVYKELKANISGKSPYKYVKLSNNSKVKRYDIHRLVALHFIINPRRLNVVDHIDGNPLNNKASNLRWCTQKENLNNPNSNKIRPVARFTIDGKYVDERASIQAYEDEFGFDRGNIVKCLKGRYTQAYGYKWEYLTKDGYLHY